MGVPTDFWNTDFYYNKVQYFEQSISVNKSLKCQYVPKQNSVFKKFGNKFTYNFVKTDIFTFCIFSSYTLQELMFIWHTVSEIRFLWMLSSLLYITRYKYVLGSF